jgi:radical SAM protein with 4Fe4S-binding SPASM domain
MKLDGYVKLSNNFFPKKLENLCLLNKRHDEIYELNDEAFEFILKCDGTRLLSELSPPKRFLNILLKNSIIEILDKPEKREFTIQDAPVPSLRYLEVQLTSKCNLNCKHCYQKEKKDLELPIEPLKKVLEDFVKVQGIRVILSGGEPLLYSKFLELNDFLKGYPARVVLLTNGTLIKKFNPRKWNIDEVQISIDGMEEAHDFIRGKGSFKKLIEGIEKIKKESEIDISFATMIHKRNLKDFKSLKKLVKSYGAKEWGIDYPVVAGNLEENIDLLPDIEQAIRYLKYRFGASYHSMGDENNFGCGTHLMTLCYDGNFLPCSFYRDKIFGKIEEGLINVITKREFVKLDEIDECKECDYIKDCRGGCRYRAGKRTGRDLLMCKVFGVDF